MWRRDRLRLIDSKIVRDGFIAAKGYTLGLNFKDKDVSHDEMSYLTPVMYLWKVHRNHPMRISASSSSSSHIFPVLKKMDKRMPAEVYKNRMDHDMTGFAMAPFDLDEKNIGGWKKFGLEECFTPNLIYSSLPEHEVTNKRDASLLYIDHEFSPHPQDNLSVVELMPSQVIKYAGDWLTERHKIISHENTSNHRLEGSIDIPIKMARDVHGDITSFLEERYDTRLTFDKE